jgi:heme-degrading monooxygenase HmoA
MAHVTHVRIKAKAGERDAVIGMFDRWQKERQPKARGYVRSILTSNLKDPEEFMVGVMFDSKENYDANSNDPEQGTWYQNLRSHLAADPDWFDGKLEREFSA